ncbi:MAG TPA: DNA translocase FtsK, partial [Isosphaeraceae bacterium]
PRAGKGRPGAVAPARTPHPVRDELYGAAIEIIIREGRVSTSLLQRALGIGYDRAVRLIDSMAEDGIVGACQASSAREVLYTPEEWEARKNGAKPPGAAA